MITTDLHTHTVHSHGADTVKEMFLAAQACGLRRLGFSEHSPRPLGYDYPQEYREQLTKSFPIYLADVQALRSTKGTLEVLLGLEIDWLEKERPFIDAVINAEPYDYLLGAVHFLGTWGFDATPADWDALDDEACFQHYHDYFLTLTAMAQSGVAQMAAHPDIIKIFSIDRFNAWLSGDHLDLVRDALVAIRDNKMSMEVSAAGLRKPCAEIYPGPMIMQLAADLRVPIHFASDAHCTAHLGWKFSELATYAASFGYQTSRYYRDKQPYEILF